MNAIPRHSLATEERAALWAARLDGSALSASDRADLNTWLNADPSHRPLLSSYCQFSADLEQQLPLIEGIKELSAESYKTAQPSPWLRRPVLVSAVLTMAAAVALFFWTTQPATQFESIATPLAQRQHLSLTDGSSIELNARTSVRVEINRDARHVRLAEGEAFFSVAKDPARPFIVETPAGAVRVTGTQFNVRSLSPDALEVSVLTGSVDVRPDNATQPDSAPLQLAPGDRLISSPHGIVVQSLNSTAMENLLAWRHGRIVFDGTPLEEALAQFARYHGRGITVAAEAATLRIGGRYSLDDLTEFLAGLESVLPVRVSHASNGTIQVTLRGER